MKPRRLHSSCSCTSCLYGSESESPSSKRPVKGGTKIDRLFYDEYLPLRQRKLIDKLIKTKTVYDDIRNQILSRSNVHEDRGNVKFERRSTYNNNDNVERSSALLDIVSLVDKGDGISSKLSECCSCCSCGSVYTLHDRRHGGKHVTYYHGRSSSHLSKSGIISKGRVQEDRGHKTRGAQFKHTHSDPCTCTLKLISKQDSQGKEGVRTARLFSKVEEETRKSVKRIRHTTSKIKKQCRCLQEKSIEKLQLAKYSVKEQLDAMQTQYVKRHETESTVPVNELGMKVRKDSLTKFREQLKRNKRKSEWDCERECSNKTCKPEECLKKLNLRHKRALEAEIDNELKRSTREKGLSSRITIEMGSKAAKNVANKLCTCTLSLRKSVKSSVRLRTFKSKSSTLFTSTTLADQPKKFSHRTRELQTKIREKKRRIGTKPKYYSTSSATSRSVSTLRKETSKFVKAEKSAPNVSESLKHTSFRTNNETKLTKSKSMLKATKKRNRRSQAITGQSKDTSTKYGLRRCVCTLKLSPSHKVNRKEGKETSNQTISQHVTSSSTETNSSMINSLLPFQCKPGICIPEECDRNECLALNKKHRNNVEKRKRRHRSTGLRFVMESQSSLTPHTSSKVTGLRTYECDPGVCILDKCDPFECLAIIKKRDSIRKLIRRRRGSSQKRFIMESKSSITPTATRHRTKKVQSSMFAYTTEVQTQYNGNYRKSPDEANRIQEISRFSGLPMVKLSSSFSFNIEISKGMALPVNQDSDRVDQQKRHEPPLELVTKETIQLRKSNISLKNIKKKVNKGTHATPKARNRIKCLCKKIYKKSDIKPLIYISTSTSTTHIPPANVTKATKTKKTKARNQQYSRETGTTIDQRRRKASSSITEIKTSEKAVPAKPHAVNQPTIVFSKAARKPAVITKHKTRESRQPTRQAVKVGSSFSFSIEFSKNSSPDPALSEKPFKDMSSQSFENKNTKKIKINEPLKHNTENRLKRCFCSLKLRNHKVSANVFAVNKLIIDKNNQSHEESVVYSTNRSQLSFASSKYGFNFKEMKSYFNENKSLYKGSSFHGRGVSSVIDTLNDNLNNCYTFSETCCLKRNKKIKTLNVKEDLISFKSFSTTFSRADVTGVSALLKRRFCTMNIRIQDTGQYGGRRHNLKDYECEPGICVPSECNPYDCQKLIQKRLLRKSSKISGASVGSRSISSNTFGESPYTRAARHQANSQGGHHPRHRREKPMSGIQYRSLPNKSHRQAVRIGSKFSFDIEFSKDKILPKGDRKMVGGERGPHMRSTTVGSMQRGYRAEGTNFGPSTSDRYLQSGIRTRDMQSNTDSRFRRCFCTLKLQKAGKERRYHDQSNFVAMKEIKRTPSTLSTGQNTRAFKPERPRRFLDPNECEPGVCVPGQCNPYECLERIKTRHKNTRDFGTGYDQQSRSASNITSKHTARRRGKQTGIGGKPAQSITSTTTRNYLAAGKRHLKGKKIKGMKSGKSKGKSSRQAVRIGSSFSFNVEFFKDKTVLETKADKAYPTSKVRTSSKSIGNLRTNMRGRGAQGYRGLHHRDSQASILSQMKSTMTSSILKRCFCTAKLQGVKNVPTVLIQRVPQTETEKIQTDKIKVPVQRTAPRKLDPYECPPGICVPGPGQCDPHACLRKINMRNKGLGTDVAKSKSSFSSLTTSQQRERKVQYIKENKRPGGGKGEGEIISQKSYSPGGARRPRDNKIQRTYPTRKGKTKTVPSVSEDSNTRRQAVRIGSTFSVDIEFFKERPLTRQEIEAAARKLKQRSQKTGGKDHRRHRGIGGTSSKMFDQISQISGTMTDRGMGTMPQRCFCTLKLQKKSQFNAEKYERKSLTPSAISRGMMTRKRQIPERRHRRLEPYECEPGVCIPGECDPNECLLRIQKRPMRDSGTATLYRSGRSVSSLASMTSGASQRVQYGGRGRHGGRAPRTTESARIRSHQKRAQKYRQMPQRQVVRIGSNYSFNVEFYKDRSLNESNPRVKAMRMHERKYRGADKSSWQGVRSRPQGSQDSRLVHSRDSQSSMPKMRSSMTDAQFLKRCFCTLKLQKSNKNFSLPSNMRNQKVYLATMNNLGPYECEPGFCVPYQCDPYGCEKRIKQRMTQSKQISTKTANVRSNSTNVNDTFQQTKAGQQAPWEEPKRTSSAKVTGTKSKKIKKCTPKSIPVRQQGDAADKHRQAVKIGSNFNFNIEFFKGKRTADSQVDQIWDNRYMPTKKKTGNAYLEKGKHVYSHINDPRGKDEFSQAQVARTESRGVGPLLKSCFCTLKFQKLGKHEREIMQKGRVIQSKNKKPPTEDAAVTSKFKKIKKEKGRAKDMAATTQTKKSKLLPYECEPGVCTPGLCDPKECLERIKRRQLRNQGTNTGKKMRGRCVNVANESKRLDRAQQVVPKVKRTGGTTSRQREHMSSYVNPKNENVSNVPGRQVVRIGSNFNFNIEIFKDRSRPLKEIQQVNQEPQVEDLLNPKCGKGDGKEDISRSERKKGKICTSAKLCNTLTRSKCDKACQNCPKVECKYTGVGPILKRCFCTMKLQKQYDNGGLETHEDNALWAGFEHKVKTRNKKTTTKEFKPPKHIGGYQNLLPYECEPGFCTPGQCDPYACLQRIKERNKTKKIGTSLYPYQKSALTGRCPGPYCTESCQTDNKPRGRYEYIQGTDGTVEERRFKNVFGNHQEVRYGSNIKFDIEFYKERVTPDFTKLKAAVPSDDICTQNDAQYSRPQRSSKQTYANDKFWSTTNTQSEVIKLENKETGVINTLKRCFCTLNLQKNAMNTKKQSKQKNITVYRMTLEDNRGPLSYLPKYNLKSNSFGNISIAYKDLHEDRETQVLYPYKPRVFNKNTSKSVLLCENKRTKLKKSCQQSNVRKGKRLLPNHTSSVQSLKVSDRNKSSSSKLSALRSFVGRCKRIFSKRMKHSNVTANLKNEKMPIQHFKVCEVGNIKSTPLPTENGNRGKLKMKRRSKFSTVVSSMQSNYINKVSKDNNVIKEKSILKTTSKRKCERAKVVVNNPQSKREYSFNNNIICSYCQIQYEKDKPNTKANKNSVNFSLVVRPNDKYLCKEQTNKNKILDNKLDPFEKKYGCDCTSMCKCENCFGDWRTALAEQREAKRLQQKNYIIDKCLDKFKMFRKKEYGLKPKKAKVLQHDVCARCCQHKDHTDPSSVCKGIKPKRGKPGIKGLPKDATTDICTCKLPCPCEKCQRNAIFSEIRDESLSPQRLLLISDNNCQTTLPEACVCKDENQNDTEPVRRHHNISCTCTMPCTCKRSAPYLKINKVAIESGPSFGSKYRNIQKNTTEKVRVDDNKKIQKECINAVAVAGPSKVTKASKIKFTESVHHKIQRKLTDNIKKIVKTKPKKCSCSCQISRAKMLGHTIGIEAGPSLMAKASQTNVCKTVHFVTNKKDNQIEKSKTKVRMHLSKNRIDSNAHKVSCPYQINISKTNQVVDEKKMQKNAKIDMADPTTTDLRGQVKKFASKIKNILNTKSDKVQCECPSKSDQSKKRCSKTAKEDVTKKKDKQIDKSKLNAGKNPIKHRNDSCTCKMPCTCHRSRGKISTEASNGSSKTVCKAIQNAATRDNNLQTPIHKHRSDLCFSSSVKVPLTSPKPPISVITKELSCGDFPFPYKYLVVTETPQTSPIYDQVNISYDTAKYVDTKQKIDKKKQKVDKRKQKLERKQQEYETKNFEKTTQIHKQPGDLCACKFPCPCGRTSKHVNVNELSCANDVLPQKYVFLKESNELVDDVGNIGHETLKADATQRKLKLKKPNHKKPKLVNKKTKQDQRTQMPKHPHDLCSCKFPCSCQGMSDKVDVNEFSCGDDVLPQKYILLRDHNETTTQAGKLVNDVSNKAYETAKIEAKQQKSNKFFTKKPKLDNKKTKQDQTTQMLKHPHDPCTCEFPCSCQRSPDNANLHEFSCGDGVLPQKYVLLGDTIQAGKLANDVNSSVARETVKIKAKQQKSKKFDAKKPKLDNKSTKQDQTTQVYKQPFDPCACKIPCSCQKTSGNIYVNEFSCSDNVLPQKYLFISNAPQDAQIYNTLEYEARMQKLEKKRQKQEIKQQKRERKKSEREAQRRKREMEKLTQTNKSPGDLCNCKFPCSCQTTRKIVNVDELACNDWPSPQKYLLLTDTLEGSNFAKPEVGRNILEQNIEKQKLEFSRDSEMKKQETVKQNVLSHHKRPSDLCTCKLPSSCQKLHKKLKTSEPICNDWPNNPHSDGIRDSKQNNDFETLHINTKCNDDCVDVDDEIIQQERKKLKKDKNKEKQDIKKQKLDKIRTHKSRSGLCTCKTPYICPRTAKNISELPCGGDSLVPHKLFLIQEDISKYSQATYSKECQKCKINADDAHSLRRKKNIQYRKPKDRSALCTCKLPYTCEKRTNDMNILEFSGGDWPVSQKQSHSQIRQTAIQDDGRKSTSNICQFDSPIIEKRKSKKDKDKKSKKKSNKEKVQQTPKYDEDLCVCPFPCTCQKCPKIPDVTEFSVDDWPSPRRCLFIDDDKVTMQNAEVCTHKNRTGAKFELLPRTGKKKSAETRKIGKLFRKSDKEKQTKLMKQGKETEGVKQREQWKETKELNQSGMDKTEFPEKTAKTKQVAMAENEKVVAIENIKEAVKNKKKIKKNKGQAGVAMETQTQMDSVGDGLQNTTSENAKTSNIVNKILVVSKLMGTRYKWLEEKCKTCKRKYIPDPCTCGVPECEKEVMETRQKKKIIPEKKCTCGLPTCEEKSKTFKAFMMENTKSKKSTPMSGPQVGSISKKSKKLNNEADFEPEFEFKSKQSKKSKRSKLETEFDSDIQYKRKKFKKSKKSTLEPELEFDSKSTKPKKKSKKSKLVEESDDEYENDPEFESKSKKPKRKSKKSKLNAESDDGDEYENKDIGKKSKKSKRKSKSKSKSKKSKFQPAEPESISKKSKLQSEPDSKSKKSKLQTESAQKGAAGRLGAVIQATCLCSHTCLCASEVAKAKAKAKAKIKPKPKSKKSKAKKPKKPKKVKKSKPKPNPFRRCCIAFDKKMEERRRRAARRRNIKKAFKVLKKGGRAISKNADIIKTNIASTQAMRSITNTLEQHYVSNFILHARDPKKRFHPKRKKGKEPIDFECSLFMGSLRRRPWLSVYYMCPWFYPHCISCLNIWKQFTDVILFLLAVGVWSPCILAIEICRAFVCCAFCTG